MKESSEAARWYQKAIHDEGMAEFGISGGQEYADSVCFHCQQSAEKNIKGLLIWFSIFFPRTHSLQLLLNLASKCVHVPDVIWQAAEKLEPYSVAIRYPSDDPDPSFDEAIEAVECMKVIRFWVTSLSE